jgi:hypothetical protein
MNMYMLCSRLVFHQEKKDIDTSSFTLLLMQFVAWKLLGIQFRMTVKAAFSAS